jgi:LacI family transcriptional regulator
MADIAKELGISIGTVGRALNNRGRINAETRKKVLHIVKKYNYRPNNIASALGKRRIIRIAAVFPVEPIYFFDEINRGFEIAMEEFNDYKLEITHIPTESLYAETQKSALSAIKLGDFDGILLATGGKGIEYIINDMIRKNIPVATFNSDAINSKRLFFIGVNYINSGRIAANMLGFICQGKGKVVIFSGFSDVSCHEERKSGFLEAITRYPKIKCVFGKDYSDSDKKAYYHILDYLTLNPDVTAVYTTSAPGIVGAGKAIVKLPENRRPILIGYDLNRYTAKMLQNGLCQAIIDQTPSRQSYYATKTMFQYLISGSVGEVITIRSQILIRENLNDYPEFSKKKNDRKKTFGV